MKTPPPRALSLRPGKRLIEDNAFGYRQARAIVEAWNPARSEVRQEVTIEWSRDTGEERRWAGRAAIAPARASMPCTPIEGTYQPGGNLGELMTRWRHTGTQVDLDNFLLTLKPVVEKTCRKTINAPRDVEDLVQEVMQDVIRAPRVPKNVKAYCYQVAANKFKQSLQRLYDSDGRRYQEMPFPGNDEDDDEDGRNAALTAEVETTLSSDGASPYYALSTHLIENAQVKKIAELAQAGFKIDEIGVAMGITPRSVRRLAQEYGATRTSAIVPEMKAMAAHVRRTVVVFLTSAQRAFLQVNQLPMAA
jgi:DNA-directed RNA polymerase specialized sigma24 family protein